MSNFSPMVSAYYQNRQVEGLSLEINLSKKLRIRLSTIISLKLYKKESIVHCVLQIIREHVIYFPFNNKWGRGNQIQIFLKDSLVIFDWLILHNFKVIIMGKLCSKALSPKSSSFGPSFVSTDSYYHSLLCIQSQKAKVNVTATRRPTSTLGSCNKWNRGYIFIRWSS